MRIVALCAFALILASCGGEAPPPAPGVPPPGQRLGCVGTRLTDCMLSLAGATWFDPDRAAANLALRRELDVNGKPARRVIPLSVYFPGSQVPLILHLDLAPDVSDDRVVRVTVLLPHDPTFRRTEREFDDLFLYDIVAALLGNRCPGLAKAEFYRFFENRLKAALVTDKKVERRGIFNHTTLSSHADGVPYCGVKFSLRGIIEFDGYQPVPSARGIKSATTITLE
jgi:hypothetical protein